MNARDRSLGISGNFQVQERLNNELSPEARGELILKMEGKKAHFILIELPYLHNWACGKGPSTIKDDQQVKNRVQWIAACPLS